MGRQLTVPPAAESDPSARELLRVWAAHGEQHGSLATNVWNDPETWGIMLVDLAKHIASAYHEREARDYDTVLNSIKQGFDAEWGCATEEPTGGLVDDDPERQSE